MKNILITGVSTGIGLALTEAFTKKGYHVFGTVRTEKRALELKEQFKDAFTPMVLDIVHQESIDKALEQVRPQLEKEGLCGLFNNAGLANAGALLQLPIEEFQQQLEVNVTGQLRIIQAFAPFLGAALNTKLAPGRIINISSISSQIYTPFLGPYCASKAALDAFSCSLRIEMQLYGIKVIVIRPGSIQTPIWDKAEEKDMSSFTDSDFYKSGEKFKKFTVAEGRKGIPVDDFAAKVLRIFEKKSPRYAYTISPTPFQTWFLIHILPRKRFDKYLGKVLGLLPKK